MNAATINGVLQKQPDCCLDISDPMLQLPTELGQLPNGGGGKDFGMVYGLTNFLNGFPGSPALSPAPSLPRPHTLHFRR
jgi:hypothetical protein